MYALVFYSHSDYSDVWPLLFGEMDKFAPNIKKYLISDQGTSDLKNDWELIRYDDSLPYQQRVCQGLNQIPEEIIIFHHEDMFLYDTPDEQKIKECCELVSTNKLDFIKFIRASYDPSGVLSPTFLHENVFYCPLELLFAIQPTVCKKEKLIKVYEGTPGNSIWEFEANASRFCLRNSMRCAMTSVEGEAKRGRYHWDSHIYPYYATAIVKGQWDFQCYPQKLNKLLKEYEIDPNIRGKNVQ